MIRENERLFNNILSILDVLLTLIAFVLAYYIRIFTQADKLIYSKEYLSLALLIIPIWFILLRIINIQTFHRIKAYSFILLEYTIMVIIGLSILFLFIFVFKLNEISRAAIFIFGGLNVLSLFLARLIIHSILKKFRKKGLNSKNIILIVDETSLFFIDKIIARKEWGFNIFALITNSEQVKTLYQAQYKIFPLESAIEKLIDKYVIDEVIYCMNKFEPQEIKSLIYSCQETGVAFRLQSDFFNLIASKSHLNYFGEIPVLTFANTPSSHIALKVKAILDFLFSLSAIIFMAKMLCCELS